jgi:hypothetical protein
MAATDDRGKAYKIYVNESHAVSTTVKTACGHHFLLFEPGGFFFARGARATYSGGAAQPFSCDSTFRRIRATGLLSADCGANLIWAKVTIPRATTRSAPDAAMRGRYFTGTSF